MKKFGFTLQEVLIAAAIVGVVAALTLPSLFVQYNQKILETSLSTAVSNFETAMSTMIIKDGAADLFGTKAWKALKGGILSDEGGQIEEFMNAMSGSFPLVEFFYNSQAFMDDPKSGYQDGIGNVLNNTRESIYEVPILSDSVIYRAKNGMFYYFYIADSQKDPDAITQAKAYHEGIELTSTAATIAIDVNGDESPNTIGRDIFFFILGANGVLYPYGGKDANYKLGEEYTCKNNRGMGCTAQLIENDYKMNY